MRQASPSVARETAAQRQPTGVEMCRSVSVPFLAASWALGQLALRSSRGVRRLNFGNRAWEPAQAGLGLPTGNGFCGYGGGLKCGPDAVALGRHERAPIHLGRKKPIWQLRSKPTVLRSGPYRFFFYAGDRHEPTHVHVERDASKAKFWLEPISLVEHGFLPCRAQRHLSFD